MGGESTGKQGQGTQTVEPVHEDLSARLYPCLEWGPGQSQASLNAVFQNAQLHAITAIQWYEDHRRPQKRWARAFRCGALVLAGIAGILPIVSQILLTQYPDGGLSFSRLGLRGTGAGGGVDRLRPLLRLLQFVAGTSPLTPPLGGSGGSIPVEQGADTPVWLATLPDDGPSGGFFQRRTSIPW